MIVFFVLQPEDEYQVVPGSQFVVSRTARKDNSSDYYVNSRKVPFRDVSKLLKECGIDLEHNRFLILQVKIPSILCNSVVMDTSLLWTAAKSPVKVTDF